jgi:hypothetical protein
MHRGNLLIDHLARGGKQALERFPSKWIPVRVKKTRQNKNLSLRSDLIGTEAQGHRQAA